jgi:hypothetical protein
VQFANKPAVTNEAKVRGGGNIVTTLRENVNIRQLDRKQTGENGCLK